MSVSYFSLSLFVSILQEILLKQTISQSKLECYKQMVACAKDEKRNKHLLIAMKFLIVSFSFWSFSTFLAARSDLGHGFDVLHHSGKVHSTPLRPILILKNVSCDALGKKWINKASPYLWCRLRYLKFCVRILVSGFRHDPSAQLLMLCR